MHDTLPPLQLPDVDAMLPYVDGADLRETWIRVGMAIKSEFGDAGFDCWDRWSQSAGNYDARACRSSWRGFKSRAGGITIATLVVLAKEGGFRFDRRAQLTSAELAEVERRRAERAARARQEQQEREASATAAAATAAEQWRSALREGRSPYLQRKGLVDAESIRYTPQGGVVVPMIRYDWRREQALRGVQHIEASGKKLYTKGAGKQGCACRLGLVVVREPILICEGYATGMTLRMALAGMGKCLPVFVAFDAYNLPVVAEIVHQAHSQCPIVLCGDDDWKTKVNGEPHNTGRIQAQIAQESLLNGSARLVIRTFPVFPDGKPRGDKDSDFNDLHRLHGVEEVQRQLSNVFHALEELQKYA